MLNIVNLSLTTAVFNISCKTAAVKPLFNKPHLDLRSLNKHRPLTEVQFFSKVPETVVSQQLSAHIQHYSF